jgi:hypothetical protein
MKKQAPTVLQHFFNQCANGRELIEFNLLPSNLLRCSNFIILSTSPEDFSVKESVTPFAL